MDEKSAVSPSGVARLWGPTFHSLRHPSFRLLLAGQFATSTPHWMDMVTRGWLIYTLTGSALLLGAIWATRGLPLLLLTLIGGVAADRFDRKRQLILAQNVNAVLNCILAALVLTGLVEVWHVFATAFFSGAAVAFQQPARQSLIPQTVTKDDLDNAVALNSTVLNLTRTLGPMLGGLSVGLLGIAGAYACQAGLLFAASLWTRQISLNQASGRIGRKRPDESWWTSLTNGFHYSVRHPTVFPLLLLGLLPTLLAQPWTTLAPVFAEDVFQIGAEGLGLLLSASGIGAVLGALVVARADRLARRASVVLGCIVVFGVGLIAFALISSLVLGLLCLGVVGATGTAYRAINQTMVLAATDSEYQGRVISFYQLDRGLSPLGSLLAGALADLMGAPGTVAAMGAATCAVALAIAASAPRLRAIR
jgi:MFS transporter, DHA1 family, staphyloferrin A biosynthesis exporter